MPAFKDEETELLASQLTEAFAAANYNERVTFYLSQPQTSVKRVITSGRACTCMATSCMSFSVIGKSCMGSPRMA